MSDLRNRLLDNFQDREYRHAYLEEFLNSVVSTQIHALREEGGWSQAELGSKVGTTQSGISRNESPNYYSWNIGTLRKLARAFDRALIVKFASFGEALDDIERFRSDRLFPPSFDKDPAFRSSEREPETNAGDETGRSAALGQSRATQPSISEGKGKVLPFGLKGDRGDLPQPVEIGSSSEGKTETVPVESPLAEVNHG